MTQLPNPFLHPSVISPRTERSAVASKPPPVADATAAPFQSSDGDVQESSASIPDYNGVKSPALVTAHGLSGKSCPLSRSEAGPSEAIDHIHEIFFYVRKLMKQPPRFVLDEAAFMADVEETPLFIREDGYLKRQA